MFTSEPSLSQRIGRMIGDASIIDVQTAIPIERPGSPDLASLIDEPHLRADLIAVGMPPADLDPGLPPDERVRRALPHLKRARNTASAWCLYRIFRDLFDFDEPHLDPTNYRDLQDKVAASVQGPDWARSILEDRAKIAKFVTTVISPRAEGRPGLADRAEFVLEVGWACPAAIDRAPEVLGERPTSIRHLERLAAEWLERQFAGGARFASVPLQLGPKEAPATAAARAVFRWHDDHRRVVRITSPAGRATSADISAAESLADLATEYPNARFDLMLGPGVPPELPTALAGRWPNVTVSGIAWANASAVEIAGLIGRRGQSLPASKVAAFSSGAAAVEWTYGRLQFAKKAIGSALGRLVEDGYFEEDEIPPLLRQILHDSAREILGLG